MTIIVQNIATSTSHRVEWANKLGVAYAFINKEGGFCYQHKRGNRFSKRQVKKQIIKMELRG